MSLDFAILAEDDTPAEIVPLSMELHDKLIDHARELKLYRILRFHDYFEDVDTTPIELPGLQKEVAAMQDRCVATDMQRFLHELHALIELAIHRQLTLYAIPD